MKKRLIFFIMAMILMLAAVSPTYATGLSPGDAIITPNYVIINFYKNDFSIDYQGNADVFSTFSAITSDEVKLYVYLEHKVGGYWSTYKSWVDFDDVGAALISKELVVPAGTYRMKSYAYAYQDGALVDYTNYTSSTYTYYE
jgi:hypothetical protein